MSTVIRLDAAAVASLIEKDPEFKLELQRAVIAEVTRRMYSDYVRDDVITLVAECFKGHKADLLEAVRNDASFKDHIDKRLSSLVQSIRSGTWGLVTGKKLSPEAESLVRAHVDRLIAEAAGVGTVTERTEKAKAEVTAKVLERIGNLSGIIAHNVNAEIIKQVRDQVKAEIAAALTK